MTSTMPAIVNYARAAHSVEVREVPIPNPTADEVLLQVRAVGVCGSDLHQYAGDASWRVNYPVTLGHEFCGVVAESAHEVRGFSAGDMVVSETAAVVNPDSPFTRIGAYNLDPARLGFGYGVDGAMAPFICVPARLLHHVPANVDPATAALTEPACVAYQAVQVNASVTPGDAVLVLGPGPIGLLCARIAALAGARPLVVAGTKADKTRLSLATALGATDTVYVDTDDADDQLTTHTDGYGYDLVVDAAGVSASLNHAINQVRPAGRVVKVGWGPQPLGFSLDPLVAKAATLQGSFSHTWSTWERVLHLQATGQLNLAALIGETFPLNAWQQAFDAMRHRHVVKSIIVPTDVTAASASSTG